MVRSASEFIIGPRFARTRWRVSNHESPDAAILRDGARAGPESLGRILPSSGGAGEASVSKDGRNAGTRGHPSRRAQGRAPQDEDTYRPVLTRVQSRLMTRWVAGSRAVITN